MKVCFTIDIEIFDENSDDIFSNLKQDIIPVLKEDIENALGDQQYNFDSPVIKVSMAGSKKLSELRCTCIRDHICMFCKRMAVDTLDDRSHLAKHLDPSRKL